VASSAAGILVQQWAVAGSIGTGRSFAQVERYSAELSDFVTRGVGAGIEELVFVGWLVPLLALGGLWALRSQPGTAILVGLAAVIPAALALGSNLPGYHLLWRVVPGLGSTRVPERLLPISCLALAALTAYAVDAAATRLADRDTVSSGGGRSRAPVWYKNAPALLATGAVVAIALDLRVAVFGAVAADHPTPAYDAFQGQGTLLELPVFRPDIHFGSVYLAYARQSPRERPQGYSTLAPPEADRWARVHRGLSCGRGAIPADVRWVVIHRGLYAQSGWFSASCPKRVEAALSRAGWRRIAVDGTIATWTAPATR
jgi:hypothetical protein